MYKNCLFVKNYLLHIISSNYSKVSFILVLKPPAVLGNSRKRQIAERRGEARTNEPTASRTSSLFKEEVLRQFFASDRRSEAACTLPQREREREREREMQE